MEKPVKKSLLPKEESAPETDMRNQELPEEAYSLEKLIAERIRQIETEADPAAMEAEGEAAILEAAKNLGLDASDIEAAKLNADYERQKTGLLNKLREISKAAIEVVQSLFGREKQTVEAEREKEERERLQKEIELLNQESLSLEQGASEVAQQILSGLKERKKAENMTEEEYAQEQKQILRKIKKFRYTARMEQAIRDAETFVMESPDASKEDIVKTVRNNPERALPLTPAGRLALERAAEKYAEARQRIVEYTKDLAKKAGVAPPENPLDVLETDFSAKTQFLKDIGMDKHLSPEDVTVQTDLPIALAIEVADPEKMKRYLKEMAGSRESILIETVAGAFLNIDFSKAFEGEEAERIKPLDKAICLLKASAPEKQKKTKIHEFQHVIFNRFIRPEKERASAPARDEIDPRMEAYALDEFAAYMKAGRYQYGYGQLFGSYASKVLELEYSHPLIQSMERVKNQMRRLQTSGINLKNLYAVIEAAQNLDELGERLELIPAPGIKPELLAARLEEDIKAKAPLETVNWIFEAASKEKLALTPQTITAIEQILSQGYGHDYEKKMRKDRLKILKQLRKSVLT
ncbi:hypothetical protein HYT45_01050 [Candidatus Uhrbacteria bacterium]|nr:hypothetical protein [Candidatus Uhrbacteria bacterium]